MDETYELQPEFDFIDKLSDVKRTDRSECLSEVEIEQAVSSQIFQTEPLANDRQNHLKTCDLCKTLINGVMLSERRKQKLITELAKLNQKSKDKDKTKLYFGIVGFILALYFVQSIFGWIGLMTHLIFMFVGAYGMSYLKPEYIEGD